MSDISTEFEKYKDTKLIKRLEHNGDIYSNDLNNDNDIIHDIEVDTARKIIADVHCRTSAKKLYFVQHWGISQNLNFFVRANSKKEALDKVWNEYFIFENERAKEMGDQPFFKYEIEAQRIDDMLGNNDWVRVW